jgi:uncharacterized membrane protein
MSERIEPASPPKAVRQSIATVLRLEEAALRQRTPADRAADAIAAFAGKVTFVVIHLLWFGLWAVVNLGLVPAVRPFDPYPFQLLCMTVSLEGVLLAAFLY